MSDTLDKIAQGVQRIEESQKKSQDLLEHQAKDTRNMRDGLVELLREVTSELEEIREERNLSEERFLSLEKKVKSLDAKITQVAALHAATKDKIIVTRFAAWFINGASIMGIVGGLLWVLFQLRMSD